MAQIGITVMTIPNKPNLDSWYEDGKGQRFRIVAIDDHDNSIEIQYFDGDVAEVEAGTWYSLDLRLIADPGDGSGPFDDMDLDIQRNAFQAALIEEWINSPDDVDLDA